MAFQYSHYGEVPQPLNAVKKRRLLSVWTDRQLISIAICALTLPRLSSVYTIHEHGREFCSAELPLNSYHSAMSIFIFFKVPI